MKTKLLSIYFLSLFFIGCSVDPVEDEIFENQVTHANISTADEEYGCAGPDRSKTLMLSEAISIESFDEVRKLYLSLLDPGVPRDGTFDPTIWNLIDAFNEAENPIGLYTTTYSLSSDNCEDSVQLTIEVTSDFSAPACEISAGNNNSRDMFFTEAASIESWDEVRKLYLSLLDPGISRNGTFDPSIWDLINAFNTNEDPIGDYTTIYTITEGDCSDSVELAIRVVPDLTDPITCNLEAGEDKLMEMNRSAAAAIPSWDEVRKLYLSLLGPDVPRNGTFDPSIRNLIDAFNASEDNLGDYTTTYTISDGDCEDSVELTIRVIAD